MLYGVSHSWKFRSVALVQRSNLIHDAHKFQEDHLFCLLSSLSSLSPSLVASLLSPGNLSTSTTHQARRQWEARETGATLQLVQAGRWWKENKFQFKDFNQAFGLTCVTLKIEWSGSKCTTTWTSISVHANANQDVTKWLSQFVNCLYFLLHD